MLDWNLIFAVLSAAGVIAVTWGAMNTRIKHLEKIVDELRSEVKDFRKLSEDLAVVKHELSSIKHLITKVLHDKEHE